MSLKSIENKFSIEIDAYFDGIERKDKLESKEYNELLELGKSLANNDFSKDSNREAVFNKTFKNISKYKGDNYMKESNKSKRIGKVAASFALVGVLSLSLAQTSFAQGAVEKIIQSINLGHIGVTQFEPSKDEKMEVPPELKGKIFDKNRKPIDVVTKQTAGKIYTAKGEEIDHISDGKIVTVAEQEKLESEKVLTIKDSNEINKYTCFKVILPSYLPNGYRFDKAEFTKHNDNKEVKNSPYVNLYFINSKTGKTIYMQQRAAVDDMKYFSGTDGKVEKVKINGVDAVIQGNRTIDWETKDALYGLSGRGNISKSELIKIAESIK